MDMKKPISFFFASRILNLPISQNHRVDRYLIFTSKIVKKMNLKFFFFMFIGVMYYCCGKFIVTLNCVAFLAS